MDVGELKVKSVHTTTLYFTELYRRILHLGNQIADT